MRNITLIIALFLSLNTFAQQGISVEKLKKHIYFLASDSLKGRKPGTAETKIAANYIRNEFKSYGLELMGDKGFQFFDIIKSAKIGNGNHLFINKFHAKTHEDNIPYSFSGSGMLKAKVVFVGYGFNIDNENFKWNDYENVDVTGKWVLILRSSPEGKRHGKFTKYNSDKYKINTAIEKGAKGVLLVGGSSSHPNDKLVSFRYQRGQSQFEIPVINIKRALANKILLKSKTDIKTAENELIQNKKPNSFLTKTIVDAKVVIDFDIITTQNVIGILKSNDKTYGNEYIVIGGHYDHLGFGGHGSGSRMPDTFAIHNGADDNASGIASVLAIAKEFANCKTKPKRSIIFIAFSAEEMGLIGSNYYVNNPTVNIKDIYLMLNLDMVGRLIDNGSNLSIIGTGTAVEFNSILEKSKEDFKYKMSFNPSGFGGSDHSSFYSKGIPVLFFNTGIEDDYHTPFDDVEKIDFVAQKYVTEYIYKLALQFANSTDKLTYKETAGKKQKSRRTSFKVTLGIMPAYGDAGSGVKVEGVTADGPAYVAGVLKGDFIVEMDGTKISDIYDYMDVLKRLDKGLKIKIKVKRNNNIKELDVQF